MNYKFPVIQTINDVLPHIEGRTEFKVTVKDSYTVINYVVCKDDTFDLNANGITGAMRRECRGLIFDTHTGAIISRPFHKFFNLFEREETQPSVVDITQPHIIMEKMDGSMIRPFMLNGHIRLGTKMGITDVAMQAETFLAGHEGSEAAYDFMQECINYNITPLFEFVAPDNKIVLEYTESDLVLLAMRNNITGDYIDPPKFAPFNKPEEYGEVDNNLLGFATGIKGEEDREGVVIRFADGHMMKIKNDWYVRIHKVKDLVRSERHIINLILNNELDDVLPILQEADIVKVKTTQKSYFKALDVKKAEIISLCWDVNDLYENDRKRIALEFIPKLNDKILGQYIFGWLDLKSPENMLMESVKKNLSSNIKWDKFSTWLGM